MARFEASFRGRGSASTLLMGLTATLLTQTQGHADEVPSATAQLPQVMVSARRLQEDAQTVPISIDTFSAEALHREDIRTTTDLQNQVPGLAICCANGQANFNFIRGIQGVQAYFAETLLMVGNGAATSLSGNSMYFDLDKLSVLKGPQGTLFGMSTNGGALLFTPRKPTDTFGGHVSAEVGDYGRRIYEGVVNLPVNEVLKLRAGLQSTEVDGYVTDLRSGQKLGTDDYTIARLVLSLKPGASMDNDLFINHYKAGGTLAPYIPVAVNPEGAAAGSIGPALASVIEQQKRLGYYRLVGNSIAASARFRQTNVANITRLRLSETLSLKNILGYERLGSFVVTDTDGTPFKIFDNDVAGSTAPGAHRLFSEELQLQGRALGGGLSYTAGLFHAESHPGAPGKEVNDLSDAFGIQTYASTRARFRTEAVYAQANLDLGHALQGLKATVGYRYTDDRRWLSKTSGVVVPAADSLVLPDAPLDLSAVSKKGSYTLGLSYQASARTLVYLTNSKGYLNGGFNGSVTQAADAPYGPESLNNFELGLKSDFDWGGMPARLNLAAYYGLYRDGQVSVTTVINAGRPQQALAVLTRNAAQGLVRGLEWHLQLLPDPRISLAFFGSYMANQYTKYESLNAQGLPIDLSGTPFVYVPRLKYGLSVTADLPLSDALGHLGATLDFTYQDELIGTSTLTPQWYDKGPSFSKLNLSIEWGEVMGRQGLAASFFITNALQNRDGNGGFGAYNSIGLLGYAPSVPRRVGLRISQAF